MNLKLALPNGRVLRVKTDWKGTESPVGYRVLLSHPSGGKTAIVVGFDSEGLDIPLQFPDKEPTVTEKHLKALSETSQFYALLPWKLLFELLPSALNWVEEEFVRVAKKDWSFLDRYSSDILHYIRDRGNVKEENLKKRFNPQAVDRLISLGFLERVKKWNCPDVTQTYYSLAVAFDKAMEMVSRFKKQEEKMKIIAYLWERRKATKEDLREAGFSWDEIRALLKKGILKETEEDFGITRLPLRLEQAKLDYLKPLGGRSLVFGHWEGLLTRIKRELEGLLDEGKSAYIFCNSSQALQTLYSFLYSVFGDRLIWIKAEDRPSELIKKWFSIRERTGIFVIGNRVSLLAPMKSIHKVFCIEDNISNFRNQFDYRLFLYELSKQYGADFILVNPMPPLSLCLKESWYRDFHVPQSEVLVVGRKGSDVLTPEVEELLEKDEEFLFLVNKSGYAYAFCPKCGLILECPRCGTFLSLNKNRDMVFCSSCRYKAHPLCTECGGDLEPMGFGIEMAIEEVRKRTGISERIFFDTVPRLSRTYENVVILHADNILSVPWFDSTEKYFSYLWHAMCISKKRLVVQTILKNEKVFDFLLKKDWEGFCKEELKKRQEEDLPPFKRLIRALLKAQPDLSHLPVDIKKRKVNGSVELLLRVEKKHFSRVLGEIRGLKPINLEVL